VRGFFQLLSNDGASGSTQAERGRYITLERIIVELPE
jgi:hypothetical protein